MHLGGESDQSFLNQIYHGHWAPNFLINYSVANIVCKLECMTVLLSSPISSFFSNKFVDLGTVTILGGGQHRLNCSHYW